MVDTSGGFKIGKTIVTDEVIVRSSWLLPATVVPLSMVIHLLSGNSRDFPFFISEADFPGIERWVFTIGLAISGLFQMVFTWRMWSVFSEFNSNKLLFVSLICGLTTGFSLFIMSFANMYDHLALHILSASLVFQVGMLWAIVAHFAIPNANKRGKKLRILSIIISITSYIVMSQAVVAAIADLEEYGLNDDTIFTLDRIQHAIDVAAWAEYTLFVGLILCLYSFEQDFLDLSNSSEE